jgi:tetratricopeptide (TPR) repeat protein
MTRFGTRYDTAFALTAAFLAVGAAFAFSRIGSSARRAAPHRIGLAAGAAVGVPDERALVGSRAIAATEADYRRFAAEDAAWRLRSARLPDLFALKRRALEDRIYVLTRSARRAEAIRELERWTARYPNDADAVLWLARLLRDAGRTTESLARYRQALAVSEGRR